MSFEGHSVFLSALCALTKTGGAGRDRTDDLLLAKQALSQLSYGPFGFKRCISPPSPVGLRRDSLALISLVLSSPRLSKPKLEERRLVGLGRLELPTSRLSGVRSNQLSYRPKKARRVTGPSLDRGVARTRCKDMAAHKASMRKGNEDGGTAAYAFGHTGCRNGIVDDRV